MIYYKFLRLEPIYYFCEIDYVFKTEQWMAIEDYPKYKVSDLGRIKSYFNKPSILKQQMSHDGYLYVSLSNGCVKKFKTHRLVALHFLPNKECKATVNHKKGCKTDNKSISLEWNTISENIQHAFDNNLVNIPRGEKRPNSKLNKSDIIKIRESGLKCVDLAKTYSVTSGLISDIKRGVRWKHV